jgi:hypothetical protein
MFEHHIQPVSLTERYRFLGCAPPSRGRLAALAVDIVNSAAHRTVLYRYRWRSFALRYLSATQGPRAGKSDELEQSGNQICPCKLVLIGAPSRQVTPFLELGAAESFIYFWKMLAT